jgi:V8-like Glu-specific endopeptidase
MLTRNHFLPWDEHTRFGSVFDFYSSGPNEAPTEDESASNGDRRETHKARSDVAVAEETLQNARSDDTHRGFEQADEAPVDRAQPTAAHRESDSGSAKYIGGLDSPALEAYPLDTVGDFAVSGNADLYVTKSYQVDTPFDPDLVSVSVTNTSNYPYNVVVLVETQWDEEPSTLYHYGAGVVIGPHAILTASHNIWDSDIGSLADTTKVYPGYSGSTPFGSGDFITGAYSLRGWGIDTSGGTLPLSDVDQDYALIITSHTFTSWFGWHAGWGGGTVHMTGYPNTLSGKTQDDQIGTISQHSTYDIWTHGTLNSVPGNSGGPLWYDGDPGAGVEPYVVGIVSTTGHSVRLTIDIMEQIDTWLEGAGYDPIYGGGGGGGGGSGIDLTVSNIRLDTDHVGGPPYSNVTTTDGGFTINYTVSNSGSESSGAGALGIYLSQDSAISTGDTLIVQSHLLNNVSAGGSQNATSAFIPLPSGTAPGTYYIGVVADYLGQISESNENNNGSTGLQIIVQQSDDYAGSTSTSGTLGVGGTKSGDLEVASDQDWFRIVLTAGIAYQFDLKGSPTNSGTLSDPYLRLLNSSGSEITFDDDSGDGWNALLAYTPTTSGTYYLSAQAYQSDTGTYQISATALTPFTSGSDNVTLPTTGGPWYALGGADQVTGSSVSDIVYGGPGIDTLNGGGGGDFLLGDGDGDFLNGGADRDSLYGGLGNDHLNGGPGADWHYGGPGNDTYWIDDIADFIDEGYVFPSLPGGGLDTLHTSSWWYFESSLNWAIETFVIEESAAGYHTTIVANGAANTIYGNSGDNNIYANWGDDWIWAGSGTDHIDLADRSAGATGANTVYVAPGAEFDVVWQFVPGVDEIDISSYGHTDFSTIVTGNDGFGNSYYGLGGVDIIIMVGVELGDLQPGDFLFV